MQIMDKTYHLNNPDGGYVGGYAAHIPPIFPYLLRRHDKIESRKLAWVRGMG
jgi:hypothetical protein